MSIEKNKLLFTLAFLMTFVVSAAPGLPPPPPGAPIDMGIGVLIFAAIGLGIRKLKNK